MNLNDIQTLLSIIEKLHKDNQKIEWEELQSRWINHASPKKRSPFLSEFLKICLKYDIFERINDEVYKVR